MNIYAGIASFDKLVQQLQVALYHLKTPLYNPKEMKEFAEKHAPGLFDTILKAISRDDHRLTTEHAEMQQQRTVVLLHMLSYFR